MNKLKCGVVGATGYAGAELVRLLLNHPMTELSAVSSVSYEGKTYPDIFPAFAGICDLPLISADELFESRCDVVFTALPAGITEELAYKHKGLYSLLVDMGSDFRFDDEEVYNKWYGKPYAHNELHLNSVYSIPELHRENIKEDTMIIGNPGCYPTSIALGLMPALKSGFISSEGIVIDSKSGITGAGRKLTQETHYPDANESFNAYKAGNHRHTPEIEQTLSQIVSKPVKVTFVPHLLPVNRGILSTIYAKLADGISLESVYEAYKMTYKDEYFIRTEPLGSSSNIRNVRNSNFCSISLHEDKHTGTLIITSCIDNMVKGAAGQAVQNMNIRFGFDEKTGLTAVPAIF